MTKGLIPFETSEYSREIFENCLKLGQDLENLGVEWGEQFLANPALLWEEPTGFTPSTLLPKTSATNVFSLHAEKPHEDSISEHYLCKISETSSDGQFIGVLSIWPCR